MEPLDLCVLKGEKNMTLVPFNKYEIDDIKTKQGKHKTSKILMQFVDGPNDCVEVKDYPHHSPECCRSSFAKLISYLGIKNVIVRQRGNRVFLIKER
jgi:hypothetical protein